MTKRKAPTRRVPGPRSKRHVSVYLGGEWTKVAIAGVRPTAGATLAPSAEFVKRATSAWWFWTLDLATAEALGQALIDVGGAQGFRTGAELVSFLRKKYP